MKINTILDFSKLGKLQTKTGGLGKGIKKMNLNKMGPLENKRAL
jgi:hypothetical protein